MFENVKIRLLRPDAKMPTQGTTQAAGYDVYAVEPETLYPGETKLIPLGFATEMDDRIHAQMKTRSGMGLKGFTVNAGIIDADYRGEWKVILHNGSIADVLKVVPGDRVAQCVFTPTVAVLFSQAEELSDTQRGAGGYGSTGR